MPDLISTSLYEGSVHHEDIEWICDQTIFSLLSAYLFIYNHKLSMNLIVGGNSTHRRAGVLNISGDSNFKFMDVTTYVLSLEYIVQWDFIPVHGTYFLNVP